MSVPLLPMRCRSKISCHLWSCSFFRWLSAEFLVSHKNLCSLSVSSIAAPMRFYTVFSTSSTTYSNKYHSARQLFDFHLQSTLNFFYLYSNVTLQLQQCIAFFLIRERSRGTHLAETWYLCNDVHVKRTKHFDYIWFCC